MAITTMQNDRQRQELGERARGAVYGGRAEGHEVAGDVRGEEALQGEEPCGVDIAGVEAEKRRQGRLHDHHPKASCTPT